MSEVRTGGTVTAAYTWLADGTKLGVRNGSGSDGFEYVGSLIYRKSGGSLQLSEALFGNGVIRLNDNGTQEVNYFLTDHLGSVRVIVDGAGTVKECNDYYPFRCPSYTGATTRKARTVGNTTGRSCRTTGELGYLDYGARMYDAGLGRWFCADPEAESRFVLTPYHYCSNNPLLLVDKDGKWDTHYIDQYNNVILQTDDEQ
ncbi:MAG: RHS repeat-associated core domain-containing protein [Odoribacter splanchnicus]